MGLLNGLRDVDLAVRLHLLLLAESSRLVELRVLGQALLGAHLLLKAEFGIPRGLFHLFFRVPVRAFIVIHRLEGFHLLDRASELVVFFLVAVGDSDGLFDELLFVRDIVYLLIRGCTRMLGA